MSQALVNAFDRDALSGWGAVIHIMYVKPALRLVRTERLQVADLRPRYDGLNAADSTPEGVITRTLKTRMD